MCGQSRMNNSTLWHLGKQTEVVGLVIGKFVSSYCPRAAMMLQHLYKVPETWIVFKEAREGLFKENACVEAHCNHHEKYHPWIFRQGQTKLVTTVSKFD